ncbi:MAG: ThiF family adenylyltransferase [Clostridiaceae bacterium]
MNGMFNPLKLSEHLALFGHVKIAIIGAGAVGSYLAEYCAKMGVGGITLVDFDTFTLENAAKHSGIIRTPEDVGRNKALAVAERTQTLMIPGGKANGIDANLCMFGPMAFSQYDAVLLALDNYAAKVYFNQLWLQLPLSERPLLIFGGTYEEMAQANCLDGHDACLQCLLDESSLENSAASTSCSGPQYRNIDGESVVVRTSGLASSMAAHLMTEQLRTFVIGNSDIANKRLCYTAYPNLGITSSTPMQRRTCPDCAQYHPPEEITRLVGTVLERTLGELFSELSQRFGNEEYELLVHRLIFAGVGYGGFILDDVCKSCGQPLSGVYAHEGRTYFGDLLCEECRQAGNKAFYDSLRKVGTSVHAFTPRTCSEALLEKTLFELGYPLGAYLWTKQSGGATDAIDETPTYTCFTCSGDAERMNTISIAR